jgi:hypothetical protein
MRGQVDWLAVLVADVAVLQPAVESLAVGCAADRGSAVGVFGRPGKQHDPGRVAGEHPLLLSADQRDQFVVEGTSASRFILWLR